MVGLVICLLLGLCLFSGCQTQRNVFGVKPDVWDRLSNNERQSIIDAYNANAIAEGRDTLAMTDAPINVAASQRRGSFPIGFRDDVGRSRRSDDAADRRPIGPEPEGDELPVDPRQLLDPRTDPRLLPNADVRTRPLAAPREPATEVGPLGFPLSPEAREAALEEDYTDDDGARGIPDEEIAALIAQGALPPDAADYNAARTRDRIASDVASDRLSEEERIQDAIARAAREERARIEAEKRVRAGNYPRGVNDRGYQDPNNYDADLLAQPNGVGPSTPFQDPRYTSPNISPISPPTQPAQATASMERYDDNFFKKYTLQVTVSEGRMKYGSQRFEYEPVSFNLSYGEFKEIKFAILHPAEKRTLWVPVKYTQGIFYFDGADFRFDQTWRQGGESYHDVDILNGKSQGRGLRIRIEAKRLY